MSERGFAHRLDAVVESATLRLNGMVQRMKAQGLEVANFTTGEPDFPVRAEIKKAVMEAIEADRSKYTPVAGIPGLRSAVAREQSLVHSSLPSWKAAEVVVSNGAKQAIFNALFALVNPGEQVLIPAPYWLSYPEMAKLADGDPLILATDVKDGYKLKPELLRETLESLRKRGKVARVLLLNSPSNPTGAVYTREQMQALGKVIQEHQSVTDEKLWIISDEIYEKLIYPGHEFVSFLSACPELRSQTVTVNGLSKSAAMTGWRVGWSLAEESLSKKMEVIQGQVCSGINSLVQWGALAALDLQEDARKAGGDAELKRQMSEYTRRRNRVFEILSRSKVLGLWNPEGAFYFLVDVSRAFLPGETAEAYCERVLEKAQVALVPGTAFGAPTTVRMSFATDMETLEQGCLRWVSMEG